MVTNLTPWLLSLTLAPQPLHVDGLRIARQDGSTFHVRGINICSLEWTATGENVLKSVAVSLDKWHANFIRLPMNQDRWFGKGPDSKDDGTSYRNLVDAVVKEISRRGDYVLLDLHWSDGGVWGHDIGQHKLPDRNSLIFWKDCAKRYANSPAVLFDLYNEPIDASWKVWRDGGEVKEKFQGRDLGYEAVGLQTLLEAVRQVGAKNIVIAGGLGYASRLDFPANLALKDPGGNGVVYASHFYPGWENVASWQARMVPITKRIPVLFGEFGGDYETLPMDSPARRVGQVLQVLKAHDWNWVAWCMHPAAHPCLISDWSYKPTRYFGSLVLRALRGESVPIAPRPVRAKDFVVYDDALKDPWQSWSAAGVNLDSTSPVHSGTKAIQATLSPGQGVQLGVVPFDALAYKAIRFWVYAEKSGERLTIRAFIMDKPQTPVALPLLQAGKWVEVLVPFSELGIEGKEDLKSFRIEPSSGPASFSLDDVAILSDLVMTDYPTWQTAVESRVSDCPRH